MAVFQFCRHMFQVLDSHDDGHAHHRPSTEGYVAVRVCFPQPLCFVIRSQTFLVFAPETEEEKERERFAVKTAVEQTSAPSPSAVR